jgi:replication initiation and membrane attachment protein DnaB
MRRLTVSIPKLPDDPSVVEMIGWIATRYRLSMADLARMYQTTQSTIHYWIKTDRISYKNLRKVRASFYYLNNSRDPHADERKCEGCGRWQPVARFREGKAICRSCENKKTLEHYRENREEELKRRKAKNWYNRKP